MNQSIFKWQIILFDLFFRQENLVLFLIGLRWFRYTKLLISFYQEQFYQSLRILISIYIYNKCLSKFKSINKLNRRKKEHIINILKLWRENLRYQDLIWQMTNEKFLSVLFMMSLVLLFFSFLILLFVYFSCFYLFKIFLYCRLTQEISRIKNTILSIYYLNWIKCKNFHITLTSAHF